MPGKILDRSLTALVRLATLGLILTNTADIAAAQPARPNVLVILADDLGYGDLGCQGANDMRTPHLDALAGRGMRLTNFYASCCVCSPTRAALMTGCFPDVVGVPGVIRTHPENSWGYLSPDARLLPQVLSDAGYHTALVGKWHLGLASPNLPNECGFKHFHGFLGDMMDDYYHHRRHDINYMRLDGEQIDPEGHATDLFSTWACEYLETRRQQQQPFFLYLAYNAPHTPIQPPDDWLARVRERDPQMPEQRARLVALIEHLDSGIGRVLETLEQCGLAEDTLVIFTSDNGGQLSVGANNALWRDGKGSVYEGGLRVPAIAAWPARIAAGSTSETMGVTMDLFPTICRAVDAPVPEGLDGRSLLPALRGEPEQEAFRVLVFPRREGGPAFAGMGIYAVRFQDWKLIYNSPFQPLELYNLEQDPREQKNLADEAPRELRVMTELLQRHLQRAGTVPWQRPESPR